MGTGKIKKPRVKKTERLLSMYEILLDYGKFVRVQIMERFAVDAKTFQRDIADLKAFIQNNYEGYELKNLCGVYYLTDPSRQGIGSKEILEMSKVLLESRGFNGVELNHLLDKLVKRAAPSERDGINKIIGNE